MTEYICEQDELIKEIIEILQKAMKLSKQKKSFDEILIEGTKKLKELRKQIKESLINKLGGMNYETA